MPRTWLCTRQANGRKCLHRNPGVKKKCERCGLLRPAKRRPRHMQALDLPYEAYLELNGGLDRCAICLKERTEMDRKLNRDHDHLTGAARGLLCHRCNRQLPAWVTAEWLDAAASYLRRAA